MARAMLIFLLEAVLWLMTCLFVIRCVGCDGIYVDCQSFFGTYVRAM